MQSFSTPVRVPDDVLPHRLDGHGHAVVLGTFHHRFQAADEALQGFLPVGGGIVLVFDVRRAGLRSDHPRAADLRDPHAAVVAFLHFRKLYRVRIRQVQIAPQHRDIQTLLLKDPLHMHPQALGKGSSVKDGPGDHLGQSQVHTGETFLRSGTGPGFHGLHLRPQGHVHVREFGA